MEEKHTLINRNPLSFSQSYIFKKKVKWTYIAIVEEVYYIHIYRYIKVYLEHYIENKKLYIYICLYILTEYILEFSLLLTIDGRLLL